MSHPRRVWRGAPPPPPEHNSFVRGVAGSYPEQEEFAGPAALKDFPGLRRWKIPGPAALKGFPGLRRWEFSGPAALKEFRACGANNFPGPAALKKSPEIFPKDNFPEIFSTKIPVSNSLF